MHYLYNFKNDNNNFVFLVIYYIKISFKLCVTFFLTNVYIIAACYRTDISRKCVVIPYNDDKHCTYNTYC